MRNVSDPATKAIIADATGGLARNLSRRGFPALDGHRFRKVSFDSVGHLKEELQAAAAIFNMLRERFFPSSVRGDGVRRNRTEHKAREHRALREPIAEGPAIPGDRRSSA